MAKQLEVVYRSDQEVSSLEQVEEKLILRDLDGQAFLPYAHARYDG